MSCKYLILELSLPPNEQRAISEILFPARKKSVPEGMHGSVAGV